MYSRGHQPFWNCELLLGYRLMRRATSLIHTSEIKILLNLPSVILVLIFFNVKALTMLMLFLEGARGRPTWSLRATWCPPAPLWWPLMYRLLHNTAVTKQWTSNWPCVANTLCRIVRNYGEKSYFAGFRGAIAPIASPIDPPLMPSTYLRVEFYCAIVKKQKSTNFIYGYSASYGWYCNQRCIFLQHARVVGEELSRCSWDEVSNPHQLEVGCSKMVRE